MLNITIVALDEFKNKVRAHIDVLISVKVFYVACPCNCSSFVLLRRRGPSGAKPSSEKRQRSQCTSSAIEKKAYITFLCSGERDAIIFRTEQEDLSAAEEDEVLNDGGKIRNAGPFGIDVCRDILTAGIQMDNEVYLAAHVAQHALCQTSMD